MGWCRRVARCWFGCLLSGRRVLEDDAPAIDHPTVARAPTALSAPAPSAARGRRRRCRGRAAPVREPRRRRARRFWFERISRRCCGAAPTTRGSSPTITTKKRPFAPARRWTSRPSRRWLESAWRRGGRPMSAIADAFTHYRNVQPDIEGQLRGLTLEDGLLSAGRAGGGGARRRGEGAPPTRRWSRGFRKPAFEPGSSHRRWRSSRGSPRERAASPRITRRRTSASTSLYGNRTRSADRIAGRRGDGLWRREEVCVHRAVFGGGGGGLRRPRGRSHCGMRGILVMKCGDERPPEDRLVPCLAPPLRGPRSSPPLPQPHLRWLLVPGPVAPAAELPGAVRPPAPHRAVLLPRAGEGPAPPPPHRLADAGHGRGYLHLRAQRSSGAESAAPPAGDAPSASSAQPCTERIVSPPRADRAGEPRRGFVARRGPRAASRARRRRAPRGARGPCEPSRLAPSISGSRCGALHDRPHLASDEPGEMVAIGELGPSPSAPSLSSPSPGSIATAPQHATLPLASRAHQAADRRDLGRRLEPLDHVRLAARAAGARSH